MEIASIYTTVPDHQTALALSRTLVTERLAACANIIPEITSVYTWKGELQQETEVAVLLKTQADQANAAAERLRQLHPYECPCVVIFLSQAGNPEFFQWVADSTRPLPRPE
jgi:periplasmic divalent cation tolerance protein